MVTGMGGMGLSLTTARMGNFYNSTLGRLNESLLRLTSGKRVNEPRDDIITYLRAQRAEQDIRSYQTIESNIQEGIGMMKTAETSATAIHDAFHRMEKVMDEYYLAVDASEQSALKNEFNSLVGVIDSALDGNYWRGVDLMEVGTVGAVQIDATDLTSKIEFAYDANDIVDTTNLQIDFGGSKATAETELNTQFNRIKSYLVKTSGYLTSLESQQSLNEVHIDNAINFESTINGVNEVEELSRMTNLDIRQQAALAMIAQGNMYRMGILSLIKP